MGVGGRGEWGVVWYNSINVGGEMKIGILGAGAYGKALASVARKSGNATYFYDPYKFPERKLGDVLKFSEAVVVAVPAKALEKVLNEVSAEAKEKPFIIATKGVMRKEVYDGFLNIEILAGPGFASEILAGKRVKLTVASEKTGENVAEKVFSSGQIVLEKTADVRGVMILSGLKNIYAIEAGRRRLKNRSDEFREYIKNALVESEKVLLYNGGFVETVRMSAGVGDFALTCGSERSRNYYFGKEFLRSRERKKINEEKKRKYLKTMTGEGVFAAEEMERAEIFLPRGVEILADILKRIREEICH